MFEIVVTVPEDAPEAALERLRLAVPDARVEAAGGANLLLWIALALASGYAAGRAMRALPLDGSPSPAG